MIDSWCEHRKSPPCGLKSKSPAFPKDEEAIFYTTQLPEASFHSFPWAEVKVKDHITFLHQTLAGLKAIHDKNIAHGSISPQSLELSRLTMANGFAAIISNLHGEETDSGEFLFCVAPETRRPCSPATPSKQADMWSLGFLWLHSIRPLENTSINEVAHEKVVQAVGEEVELPFRDLLTSMIAWDPDKRPDIEKALAHETWNFLRGQKRKVGEQESTGRMVEDFLIRKRQDKESLGQGGLRSRRVRFISPDKDKEKLDEGGPRNREEMARPMSPDEDTENVDKGGPHSGEERARPVSPNKDTDKSLK